MKRIIIKTAAFAALALLAMACNDAEYSVIENRLYISEAAPDSGTPQQVENLVVAGDVSTTIHARIAQPLDYDVTVNIGLANEFVDEYNSVNGTDYQVLPSDLFSYTTQAVIPAGSVMSGDITISVKDFTSDVTYCIPLKITSTDANVQITESTSRIMFVLATPLIQYVPIMTWAVHPQGANNWGITTDAWTLETWVWMSGFTINNQGIFWCDCTGSDPGEINIRFGDAGIDYDLLQVKTNGTQFNSSTHFATNTWYHIAITYEAGTVTMYINGEPDATLDIDNVSYAFQNIELCATGQSYFKATGMLAQVRFWTVALSQTLIQKNMNGSVPATSAGLKGYWKLDEGEGGTFYDSTSTGIDMTCDTTPQWSDEPVDFSNPNQ